MFLISHLLINSGALLGRTSFTEGVRTVNSLPYLPYIEIFGIITPLVFHGLLGLYMVFIQARYNPMSYNYSRNWWYTIQRISGVALFAFLAFHLWDTLIAKSLGHLPMERFYMHLMDGMSQDMVYLTIFIVGTLAASFHLSNGLWGFCASWGILQSRRAQRTAGWMLGLSGVVLFALWFNIIYHFATGGVNAIPVQEPPLENSAAQLALGD